MGKFSYIKTNLKNQQVFHITQLTRSDIRFSQDDQYIVLYLKKSKIGIKYTRVEIIIATTNYASYPVLTLCQLFMLDSQLSNVPLFKYDNGAAFTYKSVIQILFQKLKAGDIPC